VHALVDPLADVGGVAAEVGRVAADEGQEHGNHIAAAVGEDPDERLVLDGLLRPRVRETERGSRDGVKDEEARVVVPPRDALHAGAVDVDVGARGGEDGGEEEQARGVRGEEERKVLRRGGAGNTLSETVKRDTRGGAMRSTDTSAASAALPLPRWTTRGMLPRMTHEDLGGVAAGSSEVQELGGDTI
jgi:hypothetical protein